jgi:DNA topoisomerase-3
MNFNHLQAVFPVRWVMAVGNEPYPSFYPQIRSKQKGALYRSCTDTDAGIDFNRQLEIANFEPKQYWELKTNYRNTTFSALIRKSDEEIAAEEEKNGGKKKIDNPGIDPIANREEGEALVERMKDLPFVVTNVGKKDGKDSSTLFYLNSSR